MALFHSSNSFPSPFCKKCFLNSIIKNLFSLYVWKDLVTQKLTGILHSKGYLSRALTESLGGPSRAGIWLLFCLAVWSQAEQIKQDRTVPLISRMLAV